MKRIFTNDVMEIILNESTNEIHVRALKTISNIGIRSSIRISVDDTGFVLTSEFVNYIPKSFNGLGGFRLESNIL